MYVMKHAFRNIARSKGRTILMGCIALVIGLSACLALSIKEAAVQEKESGLADLTITATIGVDRQSMMEQMGKPDEEDEESQKSSMKEQMSSMASLSLSEMKKYAKASSVKAFYYTSTVSLNGSSLDPIDTSSVDDNGGRGGPGGMEQMENSGDFTITGYSSYEAMSEFVNGTKTMQSGVLFTEGSDALECVIHQEVATLNSIEVGERITLVNPSNSDEVIQLKVVGIYTSESTTQSDSPMNVTMMDPANQIYMSYDAVQGILDNSEANTSNTENETQLHTQTRGTYTFENMESYKAFEAQASALGLSDTYTISSSDITNYERSLQPLENLSTYATYFLMVMLAIGGAILIVLNMYHIRERKYEIGVLAAIGMNKKKIAMQFVSEIFVITFVSVLLGTGLGAIISVPVTNTLLESSSSITSNSPTFGEGGPQGDRGANPEDRTKASYIKEIQSATNINVVIQLAGVAMLLTIVSGGIAVLRILRYEPLKILSNRE